MEEVSAVELHVHGYRAYNNIWEADTGEELLCKRTLRNTKDGYAAAVYLQHLGSRHWGRATV